MHISLIFLLNETTMKKVLLPLLLLLCGQVGAMPQPAEATTSAGKSHPQKTATAPAMQFTPGNKTAEVPPDTHLTIEFASPVRLNNRGMIRIFDAETALPSPT